ncbi:MAG: hypothetical protein AABX93_01870 [Nanoarchaeota archaeon]
MTYVCERELDEEDISIYFGLISSESFKSSAERQHLIEAYGHIIGCDNCKSYYENFKNKIMENGASLNGKQVHINFELLLQNEKIIQTLFRN